MQTSSLICSKGDGISESSENSDSDESATSLNKQPAIKGTCIELEKSYYRLTKAPDPCLVIITRVLVHDVFPNVFIGAPTRCAAACACRNQAKMEAR